ncbi:MAG: hypothetical protein R2811_12015 [Flavobacteriales bacterium]
MAVALWASSWVMLRNSRCAAGSGTMQRLADSLAHASNEVDRFARGLNEPGGAAYALTRDTVVADDLRRPLTSFSAAVPPRRAAQGVATERFFRKYFRARSQAQGVMRWIERALSFPCS